jgi:hypothetical protein
MLGRIHKRLGTAGFCVAILALFMSLSGGAYAATTALSAGSVKTSTIKDRAVTASKLANNSVTLRTITPGALKALTKTTIEVGQAGATGAKGDTGAAGPQGPQGATGRDGAQGPVGPKGETGNTGSAGPSGLEGAYYATAAYDVGDTNGGAIATVACSNPTDVAFSGGVQTIGVGGTNVPVGSSFPGRMDWTTNAPKPDRLDGWIVQFASQNEAFTAPEKVTIWALCVRNAGTQVVNTFTESAS